MMIYSLKLVKFVRVNETNKVYKVDSINGGVEYIPQKFTYNDNELIIPLLGQLYDVGDINNIDKLEAIRFKRCLGVNSS